MSPDRLESILPCIRLAYLCVEVLQESWFGEFEQRDKWSFCLIVARMAARQERP
jgi:hypothetical protein